MAVTIYPMTTHKKRLAAGASSAVLLVALVAGCSSTATDENSPSADSSTSAESTPSPESTPTTEDAELADGSASVEAFCADAQSLIEGDAIEGVDPEDPDAVNAVVADMTAQIDASVAPDEIAEDWAFFSDGMKQFLAAVQKVTVAGDTPDPAAEDEMNAVVEFMSSPELMTAEKNVDAYIAANCEA